MAHAPAFEYDPFQRQAIALIDEGQSFIVAAPTGAGKTVIAEYAIETAMRQHKRAIYTAPVKALSNQKYRDFHARYGEDVGIVTGDVSLNPHAPIVIMTTEIYRNTLFEDAPRMRAISWVIFDEVHYLDDPERGTVWEEALLFSPPSVNLLALSATVPNVQQIAAWMSRVQGRPVRVVLEAQRPVPLVQIFQCQNELFGSAEELKRRGYLNQERWPRRVVPRGGHGSHWRQRHVGGGHTLEARPNRLEPLIRHLVSEDRLPAIYFAFGRRRTEELARELSTWNFLDDEERRTIRALYTQLLERYDLTAEPSARDLDELVSRGIAYHHAGMLPTLKEVVERLFTSRLLKIIFTTETFALGINMPARSVVFDALDKPSSDGFRALMTREYYQMAGRAGRRGMDEAGYVYARVNPHHVAFPEVMRILSGQSEPVTSQFNLAYATLLNLYRAFGPKLLEVYPRSFHAFQSHERDQQQCINLFERRLQLLEELGYLQGEGLTPKGEFTSQMYGYELLLGELAEGGVLESLGAIPLAMLLVALAFEPRKIDHAPVYATSVKGLERRCEPYLKRIHRAERDFEIYPRTKAPHFHLSAAMESWMRGLPFDKLMKQTAVDEGEVVRYFRMVIQLLRQILLAPNTSEPLRRAATDARHRINRDVIDAERQLRIT